MQKNKIGILYICTGPYTVFWKDFFLSFEEKFITDYEKYYYVFTDSDTIYGEDTCDRVKRIRIDQMPWPLITLMRFRFFNSIEEELKKCDYLLFSNSNIVCETKIEASEILPDENEKLFFTTHPGYFGQKIYDYPYERSKRSLAYIPWNCGKTYVIGAFFGGRSKPFLEMSKILENRINDDLRRNVIARWHDESHINRYIVGKDHIKLLSPSYCFPVGIDVDYEKKIAGVSKQDKFDVHSFKNGSNFEDERKDHARIKNYIRRKKIYKALHFFADSMLQSEIKEI